MKKKKKKKKKKLYLTPNVQYITYQITKLDIKQCTHTYMLRHMYINIHHIYKNNKIIIYFGVGDFYY